VLATKTFFHKSRGLGFESARQAVAAPELCQNSIYISALGLALSEKQIPQVVENIEK
jgi:hypothetical protein